MILSGKTALQLKQKLLFQFLSSWLFVKPLLGLLQLPRISFGVLIQLNAVVIFVMACNLNVAIPFNKGKTLLILFVVCTIFTTSFFSSLNRQHRKVRNGMLVHINTAVISVMVDNVNEGLDILIVQQVCVVLCSGEKTIERYHLV